MSWDVRNHKLFLNNVNNYYFVWHLWFMASNSCKRVLHWLTIISDNSIQGWRFSVSLTNISKLVILLVSALFSCSHLIVLLVPHLFITLNRPFVLLSLPVWKCLTDHSFILNRPSGTVYLHTFVILLITPFLRLPLALLSQSLHFCCPLLLAFMILATHSSSSSRLTVALWSLLMPADGGHIRDRSRFQMNNFL